MRRILGHMVVRNEAERYLKPCLSWLLGMVDELYIWDDQSSDNTVAIAMSCSTAVGIRPAGTPSFTENESAFRQAGWRFMEEHADARPGDWVLCVDADEFPVSRVDERSCLEGLANRGRPITFPVAEVFGMESGVPMVRTDGYWKGIHARRFVPYVADGVFAIRSEGGGSVPTYAAGDGVTTQAMTLLHLGYADPSDRRAKYERYSAGRGHAITHVQSIVRDGVLEPWQGHVPEVLT